MIRINATGMVMKKEIWVEAKRSRKNPRIAIPSTNLAISMINKGPRLYFVLVQSSLYEPELGLFAIKAHKNGRINRIGSALPIMFLISLLSRFSLMVGMIKFENNRYTATMIIPLIRIILP